MRRTILMAAGVACCGLMAAGQTAVQAPGVAAALAKQPTSQKRDVGHPLVHAQAQQDVGEQKFQQNCRRCHNEPQDLPPRITGTVLLHMRVRAGLSEADEKAILRYMTQ